MAKRICYILPTFKICGGVMVVLEHANRLKKRGYEISIINIGVEKTLDWFPNNGAHLYSIADDYPKDHNIVIATGWTTAYKARFLGLHAERWVYLVQLNESLFYDKNSLEFSLARLTYYAPYEYVVIAKWMKDWLYHDFGINSLYVPNALNKDIIFQTEPLVPSTNRLRVMIEGPMHSRYKGTSDAFLVVKDLDVEVWCVSNGNPKIGQKCDRIFKFVPYDQMRSIYSSCDVLLKMSRLESFCYPPLEMMACGGTAVITRFTGHEEYAVDGANCFIVDIGDIAAATDKIRKLSEDRELLEHLKQGALYTSAKMYNWEASIDILQNFFESPVPPLPKETIFEQKSFEALALLTEKLVVDFHNNAMGTSADCLKRLAYLENGLNALKQFPGFRLLRILDKTRRWLRQESD